MIQYIFLLAIHLIFAASADAMDAASINNFLERLQQNPSSTYSETPHISKPSKADFEKKMRVREKLMDLSLSPPTATADDPSDQFLNLVDPQDSAGRPIELFTTVEDLDSIRSYDLEGPDGEWAWSDTYWPMREGLLGNRYADPDFKSFSIWRGFRDYVVQKNPAVTVLQDVIAKRIPTDRIDQLSPSEKYDLLTGSSNFAFTAYMWTQSGAYADANGDVESWMGLCHGWAPAAFMLPRPTKAIKLKSLRDNVTITFFPSDIKGLATQLWASVRTPTRFVGGRCNKKDPQRDDIGRIRDPECFDTNPATWHLSITNQLARAKRSFVMDATYDYQVWNQPVKSYKFEYYNPLTNRAVSKLEDARVPYASFQPKDIFAKYRNPNNFTHVVGIGIEVVYLTENSPSHATEDSAAKNNTHTVHYMYDLEVKYDLDQNGEINGKGVVAGGEWYNQKHPDFMWVPERDAVARLTQEQQLEGEWSDDDEALRTSWSRLATQAGGRGYPLGRIVEKLIERSRK